MPSINIRSGWFWTAILLTVLKLWLTSAQTVFAIGPAFHDDQLFVKLAAHIINGEWLGPYDQFTLAKGPLFSLFIAATFWIGLPLIVAQQLFYAGACAFLTSAMKPWLRHSAFQCGFYLLLLLNPISYDAANLTRLMRQNLYTPLALLTIAGLVMLFTRRREAVRRMIFPATIAGISFGGFWLTREESVWLMPAVGLLFLGIWGSLRQEVFQRWRSLTSGTAIFIFAAALPILTICTLNWQHYGWFGTVEFRDANFKDAYGALTRPQVGPNLDQVPVTREMREATYKISPTFAKLQPFLEGPVGDHWADNTRFATVDRQIRGGWFMWALRDAVVAAGLAPDAKAVSLFYRQVADEVNQACDDGSLSSRPARSGFLPILNRSLARPIYETAIEYTRYFYTFDGFTAYSPDSRGDYAELKIFRDYIGTPLSYAPRSPVEESPENKLYRQNKLAVLDTFGLGFGRVMSWLGPLLLVIGFARGLESIADRKISFGLGLAIALLSSCSAYLAINILVQVTSFYNQSTAALASAYPLYLIALAAIGIDACQAWRSPARISERSLKEKRQSSLLPKLILGATAVVVFAARLGEIHLFASDVPRYDQWLVEGLQVVRPWLDGTLTLGDFFIPHGEHIPLWNRVFIWLQLMITGKWDPLVQMTVNAVLFTGFVMIIARWAMRFLTPIAALPVVVVLVLAGSIPHAWENITWGYQSGSTLALVFLVLHIYGTCTQQPRTRFWWVAQVAALLALFTIDGMWLTPLVVVASFLWTSPRKFRDHIVPLSIASMGLVLCLILKQGLSASSIFQNPISFFHAWLHLLGWPSALPGAVGIMLLPWLIHAMRLRNRSETTPFDRIIFSLGLWNISYAFFLASKLPDAGGSFDSRYGDLHLIGVLAGIMALSRLIPNSGKMRPALLSLAVIWSGLLVSGLTTGTLEGQSRHFHNIAASDAEIRRDVIQSYLLHQNRAPLEAPNARGLLYHDIDSLIELLDSPRFSAVLPSSVFPINSPGFSERAARSIQSIWLWLFVPGLIAALLAIGLYLRNGFSSETTDPIPDDFRDPWRWRISAIIGGLAILLLSAWSNPFAFGQEKRWQQTLGGDEAFQEVTFSVYGSAAFDSSRLQGAAPITPVVLRNKFFGSAPDGPGFTGTILSSTFKITTPWLVVPFAGYPIGHGNGLRIRILDPTGQSTDTEIGCPGPNLTGIDYWQVDLSKYQGRYARVVLYDGRTDTEAWVAAAAPVPTDDPELAKKLQHRLEAEEYAGFHSTLWIIVLIAAICATVSWLGQRRRDS